MGRIAVSATGPADPETVWGRYADTGRWTTWAPHLRRVDPPDAPLTPGLTGTVHGPPGVSARFVVDSVDADPADARRRTWSWTVRFGPLTLRLDHSVEPVGQVAPVDPAAAHQPGTSAGLVIEGPLWAGAGYAPIARWALSRLVAAD